MVTERDGIDPGREQPVCESRRDADAVGDVLSVRDANVDPEVRSQGRETRLECGTSRSSYDVGEKENAQSAEL
jgi:hypothetical protein